MGIGNLCGIKKQVKCKVWDSYEISWKTNINNQKINPGLRLYRQLSQSLSFQPYLDNVQNFKYRKAISKLRSNSHVLEIERARYITPKPPPVDQRLCHKCNLVEDEIHFLITCSIYETERSPFFLLVANKYSNFPNLDAKSKFILLLTTDDPQIQNWVGKFIYNAFQKRGNPSQ